MHKQRSIIRSLVPLAALSAFAASSSANEAATSKPGVDNQILVELKIPDIKFPAGNKPLECRKFRVRILDLKPGKEVGIHSHENRPGALSIAGGEGMTVHAYNYAPVDVPFGGSYKGYNDIVHYAVNLSQTETLSIMTSDLLDDGTECNGKTYPQYTPLMDGLVKENHPFYANAPQTLEEDEVNHEYFRTLLQDIKIPAGKSPLAERSLRVRKVTLAPSASVGVQDYANRPTYIMNFEGKIEVSQLGANEVSKLNAKEAANLINAGQVNIRNAGDDEASYFVIELWDPKDTTII
ncbi:hypothetical protein [Pseudoxanthomonas dokdonensis]|uniref:Uncharacterized protein n=1 Tax=Pseudoxanthomonas dokdonensis TaxID=344882 RepID=A0A0R0CMN5_9GAMM|nr:hypothetical protein [Pseudoxanthomonas dokdonensis]KRG71183.1 hypothetical protein ABB29_05130 [Pseudoxanthomonas dokdonensis]